MPTSPPAKHPLGGRPLKRPTKSPSSTAPRDGDSAPGGTMVTQSNNDVSPLIVSPVSSYPDKKQQRGTSPPGISPDTTNTRKSTSSRDPRSDDETPSWIKSCCVCTPLKSHTIDSTYSFTTLDGFSPKLGSQPLYEEPEEMTASSVSSPAFTSLETTPPITRTASAVQREAIPSASIGKIPNAPRAHWEHVREAFLPSSVPVSPTKPENVDSLQSPALKTQPHTPSTPSLTSPGNQQKPSRFARFGFRTAVEQARALALSDAARTFRDDIDRATRVARSFSAGLEGFDSHSGSSTTFQLSQIGNQAQGSTNSITSGGFPRFGRLRRTPSLQSMATTITGSPQTHRFSQLQVTLNYYAGSSPYLPKQTQVLSVLLAPFLGNYTSVRRAEDARSSAIDVFEFIVGTWKSQNIESEFERFSWCVRAAMHSIDVPRQCSRLLRHLSYLLPSPSAHGPSLSPAVLQSLLQQLLLLQCSLNPHYPSLPDPQLQALVLRVRSSEYGRIDEGSLRAEYGCEMEVSDDRDGLLLAVLGEAVTRMLRVGSPDCRTWILHTALESFWPVPNLSCPFSGLQSRIAFRRVAAYTDFVVEFLTARNPDGDYAFSRSDADLILSMVQSRIIPEASLYHGSNLENAKSMAPRIILRLLVAANVAGTAASIIISWQSVGSDWTPVLERELQEMIEKDDVGRLLTTVTAAYRNTTGDCRNYLMSLVLPHLFKRLVRDPIPPTESLNSFLKAISQSHPQLFFKPLFDCAKASQDIKVVEYLCVLAALTRHIPDLLIQNAEMVSIALMGGVGAKIGKAKEKEGSSPTWGRARIGQCVIMVELLFKLDQLVREKPNSLANPASSHASALHFFNDLETKLSILISAREQTSLIPYSQRILLVTLFRRIRLFTTSQKSCHWLPCIVNWASQGHPGAYIVPLASQSNPFLDNISNANLVTEDVLEEAQFTLSKVGMIYASGSSSRRNSRPTSFIIPFPTGNTSDFDNTDITSWDGREAVRASIPPHIMTAILPLLVLVSAQLEDGDYRHLAPALWAHHLESDDKVAAAAACFLFMQCSEKIKTQTVRLIQDDLHSSLSEVRLRALQRLSVLYSRRHQISSQTYLPDRNHRRPFKLAGKPLSFVATDVGAPKYVPDEPRENALALLGASLPAEIRRKLMELNWVKSTEEREDDGVQWNQLPLSVLPRLTLDIAENEQLQPIPTAVELGASPKFSGRANKLSRSPSSVGGYSAVRRRVIFPPALTEVFSALTRLTAAQDVVIAHAAQNILFVAVRDDPALVSRPMLEALQDPFRDPYDGVLSIHTLLHLQAVLPPTLSHHVFNHFTGYIKALSRARDTDNKDSLVQFATVLPTLSRLATHVRDLSVRDFRRNKVDGLLLPTFDLWFSSTLPSGIVFPQAPSATEPQDGPPISLLHLTSIRTAQNMLLYRLLKRYPKEVRAIRNNLNTLQLPSIDSRGPQVPLGLSDFVPVDQVPSATSRNDEEDKLRRRSLTLSRSYLLLVTQLFRSLSRNVSDRAELAKLLDGVNLILVVHGSDLVIVAHALVAFMTASSRFRRFFSSNSGFLLMMPAVIKVYCEARPHDGIRSAVEYAIHRFFALHDKAFVFQTLDVISQILVHPKLRSPSARASFAEATFSIFDTLHNPFPSTAPDSAGIHNSSEIQEREALMTMLSETPEVLLDPSSHQSAESGDIALLSLTSLMDKWRGRRFLLDDTARLLLTIIAHSPGLKRSENFLRLLACWARHLHNGSTSARSVLQLGVEALSTAIFSKAVPRPRPPEETNNATAGTSDAPLPLDSNTFFNPHLLTDFTTMRQEYILLLIEFCQAGGRLTLPGVQRAFSIVNSMLRDQGVAVGELASDFVNELSQRFLVRDGRPPLKQVVAFLGETAPLLRSYGSILNLSRAIETVTALVKDPSLHGERDFTQMVVSRFCGPALDACTAAAARKALLKYPARVPLASLLAAAVSLQDMDVIGLIEGQQPSAQFFAGLILPLCLEMQSSSEMSLSHRSSREYQAHAWVRLLAYTMDACSRHNTLDASSKKHTPFLVQTESRASGEDSSLSAERSTGSLVAVSLQIVKVIVIRAGDDITMVLPDIWSRLAQFLQRILHEGDLGLSNLHKSQTSLPSPLVSPSSPPFSPDGASRSSVSSDPQGSSSDLHQQHVRVVDYLLLSIVEFIILFRSPLLIQMRLWIQERLVRLSPMDSPQSTTRPNSRVLYPRDWRRTSSIFSKIRQRHGSHSPSASPTQANQEFWVPSDDKNDGPRAGYTMAASRPPSIEPLRPILHLGPMTIPSTPSSRSVDSDLSRHISHSNSIALPELVVASINRMHATQAWFGYGNEEVNLRAWNRIAGLENVRDETRLIVHEFKEIFYPAASGSFVPPDTV
ncbi:hypothetical protein BS47DRAFT_1489338 [Hydnum rufescens UP504]|uniref:Uncharacterized protein n=1 Tax=Hydnum rufescens UP504 TaxID=1448309 RepID=A0A9P6AIH4_9AGAM|nr:hypothetical protein BS47DRAFT_1489338 [Hydnum rufescens UP504]